MKSENVGDMHINQFNALFKKNILRNAIINTPSLELLGFRLSFSDLEVHKPFLSLNAKSLSFSKQSDRRLLPKNCREQNLTYGGNMFVKMKFEYNDKVLFDDFRSTGLFPIMLKSDHCHLSSCDDQHMLGDDPREPGGYFIIDGHDKLLRFHVAQKRNYLFALKKKSKDKTFTDYSVFIRSVMNDEIGHKNEIRYCSDGNVLLKVYLKKRIYLIPVVLVLRAFLNCTDEEIFASLESDQRVLNLLAKMRDYSCYSQKECLEYLGLRFKPILKIDNLEECGKAFLKSVVLVHLNKSEDKFNLIIEAIKKLFRCYDGKIHPDDIDNPSNFELYTETQLFSLCVREKLEEIKKLLSTRILNLLRNKVSNTDSTTSLNTSEAVEYSTGLPDVVVEKIKKTFDAIDVDIGAKIKKLLSTGNITTMSCSDLLQTNGFAIMAERINFWRFASHFESVSRGAFFSTLKITSIRKLRPESWGFFCPINTPDGAPCGLLNHLSKSCFVSDISESLDCSVLYDYGLIPPSRGFNSGVPVFYNGKFMGNVFDSEAFTRNVRDYRSANELIFEISLEKADGVDEAIYIFDTLSNLYRKVYNMRSKRQEWIGMKEQVFMNIMLSKYTPKDKFNKYDSEIVNYTDEEGLKEGFEYREIDNLNIFSTIGSCSPFADHNPSPRNIYQCQMSKQAMGISASNLKYRTDNKTFFVNYLQSPMVRTTGYETFKGFPIGFNCVVAVLSYTGYDMEDAVVINKSSSERGLFSSFIYKNEKFELEKGCYIDYTPSVGTKIVNNDVILRYVHPDKGMKSLKYDGSESAFIDKIRVFHNEVPCVTVTLRISRGPNIGDKFCSRHGQKGVCSILYPEIDMPFTEQGLRPDIIINPHAFPSRMTLGMLLESMSGKSAMDLGEVQDCSPFLKKTIFDENSKDSIGEQLKKCGFNYYGNEPMYSGITGTEFKTDIFIGSVYYQRLRHMVNDKFQVRTSGAIVATTHQPVGGRKNKGGVRFGEMEKDALVSHGAVYCLKDRLMDCSDKTNFTYCCKCKSILFTRKQDCSCGSSDIKTVVLPYVYKYLCCELFSMNINLKIDY